MRKGVTRKIRRLTAMILSWHMMFEVVYDILEDIP
jgi:hypothetical protein